MGKGTAEERFWIKVNKTDTCWLWIAGATKQGYGYFSPATGQRALAHRWSYEELVGPIPDGLVIDHLCRVRRCVNPAHLEAVTQQENVARGASAELLNGTRTSCVNGHEYTDENTYRPASRPGNINCRECHRIRQRAYHHKKTAAKAQVTFTEVT